jgi:hypothetical protein
MDSADTGGQTLQATVTAPKSYRIVGPPDLLHDLALDFIEVGWQTSVVRWQAVVTAPPADADAPDPEWPTEVTLSGIGREDHATACRDFFGGSGD